MLCVFAMAFSLAIGVVMAAARVWGRPVVKSLGGSYVEFFRNTPLLVQLFFWAVLLAPAYVGGLLPGFGTALTADPRVVAVIGLSVYTGSYVTETVRSGILSVDPRQREAARSRGLTQVQALRYVVLPQAVRTVIPPLGNIAIALVKNSAVASAIAANELLKSAGVLETRTGMFEWFLAALLGYWSLTVPLAFVVGQAERRLAFAR